MVLPGRYLLTFGWERWGLSFFFMISGFVIFMSLKKTNVGMDFLVSRFSRLFPAFWVSVCLTYVVVKMFSLPGREVDILSAITNLTMLPRFFGMQMVDGVYWSLEKELIFYVVMYCIYRFGMLGRIREILILWMAVIVAVEFVVGGSMGSQVGTYKAIRSLLLFQFIPFFSFGIVCYFRFENGGYCSRDTTLVAMAIAVINNFYSLGDLIVVFFYLLVFHLLAIGWLSVLSHRILLFFGAVSYPLYLIHQNVGYVLIRSTEQLLGGQISIAIAVVVSVLLAILVNKTIERPSMKIIRGWYGDFKNRSKNSVLGNA